MHKWDSAIDGREESVACEWLERLSQLTGTQIKNGLDNWNESWPPTCDEFKNCCLKQKTSIPYHRFVEPKLLLESDSEKAHRKQLGTDQIKIIKAMIKC